MAVETDLSSLARCLAEPARAAMCVELLGGQALSAGELARVGGTAPSTASEHLSLLRAAGLVSVVPQGRHRYYRLANEEAAELVEFLTARTAPRSARTLSEDRRRARLRASRTCYDHLAGVLAVEMAHALVGAGAIGDDAGTLHATERTRSYFLEREIDINVPAGSRRPLVRSCLDWTERRSHIAGHLGAALLGHLLANGSIVRQSGTRAVALTGPGKAYLHETLGLTMADEGLRSAQAG